MTSGELSAERLMRLEGRGIRRIIDGTVEVGCKRASSSFSVKLGVWPWWGVWAACGGVCGDGAVAEARIVWSRGCWQRKWVSKGLGVVRFLYGSLV